MFLPLLLALVVTWRLADGVQQGGKSLVTEKLRCGLDPRINAQTFESYVGEIGNIFGSACGRNRGIFVTTPADGHTYNCANFPTRWNAKDANAVKALEPAQAVAVLDEFIKSAYFSSPQYVRAKDPGACDFEAMSELTCGSELPWQRAPWVSKLSSPIRGVNLGGLFILTKWITPGLFTDAWAAAQITDHYSFSKKCASIGVCGAFQEHVDTFFTSADFVQMKLSGINTVRIPVGFWLFESLTSNPSSGLASPKEHILAFQHPLTKAISTAVSVGLYVILDLEPVDTDIINPTDAVAITVTTAAAIAQYLRHIQDTYSLHNVILVEIGSELGGSAGDRQLVVGAVEQVRAQLPEMPVLLLESSELPSGASSVYINTKVYHGFSVQDVASDSAPQDREKLYAHEKIACGFKAPLHFTTCMRAPTLVGEFSLAIDNCMPGVDKDYANFGQCERTHLRQGSPWWKAHLHSFAMRQLATFERELGWVFWTYKLDSTAESNPNAVYWSYRLAVEAGLVTPGSFGANNACDHYPAGDYVLGDDTLAPTPLPSWWVPPVDPQAPVEGSSRQHNPTKRPSSKPSLKPSKQARTYSAAPTNRPGEVDGYTPGQVDPAPGSLPDGEQPGVVPGYVPGDADPGATYPYPGTDGGDAGTDTSPVGVPPETPPIISDLPSGVAGDVPVPPMEGMARPRASRAPSPQAPAAGDGASPTHPSSRTHPSLAPTFPTGGDFKDGNGDSLPSDPATGDLAPGQVPGQTPGVTPGFIPGEDGRDKGKDKDSKDSKDSKGKGKDKDDADADQPPAPAPAPAPASVSTSHSGLFLLVGAVLLAGVGAYLYFSSADGQAYLPLALGGSGHGATDTSTSSRNVPIQKARPVNRGGYQEA